MPNGFQIERHRHGALVDITDLKQHQSGTLRYDRPSPIGHRALPRPERRHYSKSRLRSRNSSWYRPPTTSMKILGITRGRTLDDLDRDRFSQPASILRTSSAKVDQIPLMRTCSKVPSPTTCEYRVVKHKARALRMDPLAWASRASRRDGTGHLCGITGVLMQRHHRP